MIPVLSSLHHHDGTAQREVSGNGTCSAADGTHWFCQMGPAGIVHVRICDVSSPPHGLGWVERFLLFCQMGLSRGWSGAARSRRFAHGIVTLHFVIDREQNQQSGSYQQCKQNTEYNRNNPMSTSEFNPFRSCDYLCCADPDPEGKFASHWGYVTGGLVVLLRLRALGAWRGSSMGTKPSNNGKAGTMRHFCQCWARVAGLDRIRVVAKGPLPLLDAGTSRQDWNRRHMAVTTVQEKHNILTITVAER